MKAREYHKQQWCRVREAVVNVGRIPKFIRVNKILTARKRVLYRKDPISKEIELKIMVTPSHVRWVNTPTNFR